MEQEHWKRVSLDIVVDIGAMLEAYSVALGGLRSKGYRDWPQTDEVRRCIWNHVPSDPVLTFLAVRTQFLLEPQQQGLDEMERINVLSTLLWLLGQRVLEITHGSTTKGISAHYHGAKGSKLLPEDPDA